MRLCFLPCASLPRLALLSLALLTPIPWTVTSYPHFPAAAPEWEAGLLRLRAALGPRDPRPEEGGWGREALLRAQRGELTVRPLSPFPGGQSLDGLTYQDAGEEGEGGKRNEALTSIAGGLQAFSREKGGFGFRFGKRRTEGGWREGGREGAEEEGWN
ncbi:uncharacterized protein qrfp [Centroberyx gerrardi]|uniref:uncharacterized protein qrfp n=1 Tax=Centroberyx gerrardi TaxID=166262 RepID=UPI003AAE8BE1